MHNFAFVDVNNVVVGVAVFDTNNVDDVTPFCVGMYENTTPISCTDHGIASTHDIWDGTSFKPLQPHPSYVYVESLRQWFPADKVPNENDYYAGPAKVVTPFITD
jgi:hypothetical protein